MTRTHAATRPLLVVLAPLALLLLVVAGCGPGGGEASTPASSSAAADSAGDPAEPGAVDAGGGSGSARAGTVAQLERAVVATGEVHVDTDDVEAARDEALRLTRGWGGLVADEQTSGDDRGRARTSTMVLRVPSPRFDDALAELGALGRVTQQTRSAEDVTTQVVDTDARVRAAERSIRSIERLLSRAERLGDVIRIESDLARRQADLDSLKQQQAYLADQTSLGTVTLHLQRPPSAGPATDEARGFLAGLRAGWDAMTTSALALSTVVGAVLPFAALLALVGVPAALLLRHRRVTGAGGDPTPAP